jgi:PAS domain S-box-containing protein
MSTVPPVSLDLGAEAAGALHDVAAAAGRSNDASELGRVVVDRARRVAGGNAAILRWLDPASRRLGLVASAGLIGDPHPEVDVDAPTGLQTAFSTGRPVIVNDYLSTGQATEWGRRHSIRAYISVPLLLEGRPVGTLSVLSQQPHEYRDIDAFFLALIAAIVAPALQSARLNDEVLRHKRVLQQVYEALPIAVIVFDGEGKALYTNRAAKEMVGPDLVARIRDRSLPLYTEDGRLMSPEDRPTTRALSTGQPVKGAIVGFDIEPRRWGFLDVVPILNNDGGVESMVSSMVEVTSLKAVETALRESRDQLAAVVANAPVILFACDDAGVITLAEGKGLANLGLDAETLPGRSVAEVIVHQPDGVDLLHRALEGETVSGDFHLMQPDAYLEGNLAPIIDADGNVVGASGVVTDVTDRVRADLAQRQADAKSRLMAMMNHEVRGPLNSILGFAHLLTERRTGQLTAQQRRYVDNIQVSGKQLLELVNESLNLARVESGADRLEMTEFPAHIAIERCVDQLRPMAESRGVKLDLALPWSCV